MKTNTGLVARGRCPNCNSKGQPIVYGLPDSEVRDVVFGGCILNSGFDPEFYCEGCQMEYGHGGRNYLTQFSLDNLEHFLDVDLGIDLAGVINLLSLSEIELAALAKWNLEARHELAYRGYPRELLEELAVLNDWSPLPLEAKVDIWFYWDPKEKILLFGQKFFSHGYRHVRVILSTEVSKTTAHHPRMDLHDLPKVIQDHGLVVWNFKFPLTQGTEGALSENSVFSALKNGLVIEESELAASCSKVPDSQVCPGWFNLSLSAK